MQAIAIAVGILSLLLLLPLGAAMVSFLLPARRKKLLPAFHLGITLVQLACVVVVVLPEIPGLAAKGNSTSIPTGSALTEVLPWLRLELGNLGILRIDYRLGVDGLSAPLLLLHCLLMPIAIGASWNLREQPRTYFALMQLLNASLVGTFLALDFVLFYLFFEVMLLPMFFLIGGWGGPRRTYAALKFFLFTLLGSVLMLGVLLGLPYAFALPDGTHSTSLALLSDPSFGRAEAFYRTPTGQQLGFWLLFGAFAIKLPAVPVHTWLPDAHVEASTPISVLLAGILLKAGGYGMMRIAYGLFPSAGEEAAGWVQILGVIGIVFGSLVALAQRDLKRLVAYSSVAHMGYVLLGLSSATPEGWNGAALQLFAHGLVSALLFLGVGVLYDRFRSRQIDDFGGLWQRMPAFTGVMAVGIFAGLGLPGTAPFVAEFLALMGSFAGAQAGRYSYALSATALLGVVLGAGYFLWAFQRMFLGSFRLAGGTAWEPSLRDLTVREHLLLWPLVAGVVLAGIWPWGIAQFFAPWIEAYFSTEAVIHP